MHVRDVFQRGTTSWSFEFFPPKTAKGAESLFRTVGRLEALRPNFVSVTYGAGGSTRDLTHDLVVRIKTTTDLEPIPHLTCVLHEQAEILEILERYAEAGVENIMALDGDPPQDRASYDPSGDEFQHAADLVRCIRRFNGWQHWFRWRCLREPFSRRAANCSPASWRPPKSSTARSSAAIPSVVRVDWLLISR